MQTFQLNDGNRIPILGFGTWKLNEDVCQKAVLSALEVGFRHIDTADTYSNHEDIAIAMKQSGLTREELFITTKVWWSRLTRKEVLSDAERFLNELKIPYIDLLLIHWPNKNISIRETLSAMNELKEKGIVKSIGVSNFTIKHLNKILNSGFQIAVNQVEFHPSFNQKELKDFCDKNKIMIIAYSPTGQGLDLKFPEIIRLAKKYSKTESQIILRWLTQKQIVAIPRSSNPVHIRENFESLNFELEKRDVKIIDNLSKDNRLIDFGFSEF